MTSEYANQCAYDAIQVHGGSGFIMEYKAQRLYRDARIFSIYEGTTQLQVVAALRYIINGTYLALIKEFAGDDSDLADAIAKYEQAIEIVKAFDNQEVIDYLGRSLYDMTGNILLSLLLNDDARRAAQTADCPCADSLAKSNRIFSRMAKSEVERCYNIISNFKPADLDDCRVI